MDDARFDGEVILVHTGHNQRTLSSSSRNRFGYCFFSYARVCQPLNTAGAESGESIIPMRRWT